MPRQVTKIRYGVLQMLMMWMVCVSGCATSIYNAVPARQLPEHLLASSRSTRVPLTFSLLGQTRPEEHYIGPGDILGIYITGVIHAAADASPMVRLYQTLDENAVFPLVGEPFTVKPDGTVSLPLVGPIRLSGKSLSQAVQDVRLAYSSQQQLINPETTQVRVELIKPRTYHVTVIREDSSGSALAIRQGNTSLISRNGSAHSLEMPAYENDVLHALSSTGGLPGDEAWNVVWIIRNPDKSGLDWDALLAGIKGSVDASGQPCDCIDIPGVSRIPLRIEPGSTPPFSREGVILHTGDVVFIESRNTEFFYAGGLLPGSQIPLPRDRDLDVLAAMTIAGGAIDGPAGIQSGGNQFRSGVGNVVPPSRVIILRTVDKDRQIRIYVNLKRAMHDPKERINIMSGDIVMLKYSPGELAANVALNLVNLGYSIPN